MDKDPFDGMTYKNDANGVSLCIVYENGRVQCTDIYVPEDVTEVRLTGCEEIEMLDTDESFPNVTKLIIGKDIERIQMANSLFPNVREVISESCWFTSGKYVVFQFLCDKDEIFLSLENTFCLHPDEILDLKDINGIDDYALDGCMTTNLINTEKKGTVFSDVRTIIRITQNGHSVYIPRFFDVDDIYIEASDDIITMNNILKFTQENKMRIFDFLISENREYDFCNILSDMECNYEELMLILKILDAKRSNSVLMRAAVLDRVQKTEKKEKTKENLSV